MGGFFGAVSKRDVCEDVFFGVDYHSHLGTKNAGMVVHKNEGGFQRQIHSISAIPFRTKFEHDLEKFEGNCAMGCISDNDPQPLLVRSHLGVFALSTIGSINNKEKLVDLYLETSGKQFMSMSSGQVNETELVALIINQKETLLEGIQLAQKLVKGSMTMLVMTEYGSLIAARDRYGRLPVLIGKSDQGHCVSMESFVYEKLGYETAYELGPNEIVELTADEMKVLAPAGDKMRVCSFMWVYYGYPNSTYEGTNVEVMRYRNGEIMARDEKEQVGLPDIDIVAGVPDSGLPHGIGYSIGSGIRFGRPFIKYTPTWSRSFMPSSQKIRNKVAHMKQVPVKELIEGKKLLLVDDSIVRGTQLRETVDFLYETGAKEVHMRSACPPIMYGCKYLQFSASRSEMELIARYKIQELEGDEGQKHLEEYADARTERGQKMLKAISDEMGFDSLRYQSLEGMIEAIGIDRDKLCTYCWDGRE